MVPGEKNILVLRKLYDSHCNFPIVEHAGASRIAKPAICCWEGEKKALFKFIRLILDDFGKISVMSLLSIGSRYHWRVKVVYGVKL